ncbi:MAG TPA: acetyltransferase [Kofleriaceae bacterium]|nr:acetyltransferase [Kofleriaceae bacterium]
MKLPPIAVYGAGGFGREVAWLAEQCEREVHCFIDDAPKVGSLLGGIPVITLDALRASKQEVEVALGIGSPSARQSLAANVESAGLRFAELVHPRVEKSRWVRWGTGPVICAGNILTCDIELGHHVQLNLDCTIGHDVRLGDFATLAPGVHVSGWVFIGARAYVGTGASIINGTANDPIVIGDDAVIGAQACVVKSIGNGVTAIGVPARPR